MKRLVLLILVLILTVDFTEDGFLSKVKFCPPNHSAKTSVTSSNKHPDPGKSQIDLQHELASTKLPGDPYHCDAQPLSLDSPPNLKIMQSCHLSSAGGIPFYKANPSLTFFTHCLDFSGEVSVVSSVGSCTARSSDQIMGIPFRTKPRLG